MIRRPPRSTLFPTRRSSDLAAIHGRRNPVLQILAVLRSGRAGGAVPQSRREPDQDRKSTRLNSSHVEISYAVFCLKKKKKKTKPHNNNNKQQFRIKHE